MEIIQSRGGLWYVFKDGERIAGGFGSRAIAETFMK